MNYSTPPETFNLTQAIAWGKERGMDARYIIRRRVHHGHHLTINSSYGKGTKANERMAALRSKTWKEIFEDVKSNRVENGLPKAWTPCPEWFRDEMLCVLPPIYFNGGFAVSEAADHEESGAVYLCFPGTLNGQYVCGHASISSTRKMEEAA